MKNNIIQTILEEELDKKNVSFPDLTSREKEVLDLQGQKKSLSQIGSPWGISKERVRQIGAKARSKIEQRKKVIKNLTDRLDQYVFTESEVWNAFLKFYKKKKLKHATIKMKWQDFCKVLWKHKQK